MLLTLHDFFTGLLRGTGLLGLALAAGGVVWGLAVLRAPWSDDVPPRAARRCLDIVGLGALVLGLARAAALLLESYVLSVTLGRPVLTALLATPHFAAGIAHAVLALGLALAVVRLRGKPRALVGWAVAGLLAALIAMSGAWLTHAVGRLAHRAPLMMLTLAHQLGAAAWVGGLVQLGALWRLARRDAPAAAAWPTLVRRFSSLAAAAVGVLVLSALPLTWTYAGSWQALIGTGYGSLVVTKAALLVAVLALAFVTRRTVWARDAFEAGSALRERLPRLAEAETVVLVIILFAAASLSAQPPAADQPLADTATGAEIVEVFRPKIPSLHAPSLEAMQRSRAEMASGKDRTREAYLWSNFSHNVSGLILLGTSLFALVGLARGTGWDRHWPLGFVALAVFVYLRAAANEGAWPFGPTPLWHIDAEGLQHRVAAGLVLALGLVEWRARARVLRLAALPYVLPVLAGAGSVLLLTHSHAAFQSKASFLVQVTHSTMGALAALLAAARWLELRLAPPASRWAGIAASLAMVGIALVLVFYREANLTFAD
jgi:putative copper resistance protein D